MNSSWEENARESVGLREKNLKRTKKEYTLGINAVNITSLSGLQRPVVIFPRGHAVVSRMQSTLQCLISCHTTEAFMQGFSIPETATMWKIIVQLLSFVYEICGVCVCLLRSDGRENSFSCCRSQIQLIKILLTELMIENTHSDYFY